MHQVFHCLNCFCNVGYYHCFIKEGVGVEPGNYVYHHPSHHNCAIFLIRRYLRNVKRNASNTISDVSRNLTNLCDTENVKGNGITFYARSDMHQIGIPSAMFIIEYVVRVPGIFVGAPDNGALPITSFPIEASPVISKGDSPVEATPFLGTASFGLSSYIIGDVTPSAPPLYKV